jgi:undecaprenyl-diphosphatase
MRRLYVAIYAAGVVLFGLLCYSINHYQHLPGDIAVYNWFAGIELPFVESLMRFVSFFGETIPAIVTVAVVVIVLFFAGSRLEAVFFAALPSLTALLVWLIKTLVDRPRPAGGVLVDNGGLGFPSGHVTYAVVFAGFLFCILPEVVVNKALARWLRLVVILVIAAMIVSRLYLGEHWLSDALGGVLLGGLVLTPGVVLYKYCKEVKCPSCLKSRP